MNHRNTASRGFALVAALFMIVVLAALGLFALRMSSTQQQSINLTIQGSRAQAAANAGIEFAANRVFLAPPACPNTTLNLNQGALAGFAVRITCVKSNPDPVVSGIAYPVFELSATATIGTYGQPDYSSRTVTRTFSTIP